MASTENEDTPQRREYPEYILPHSDFGDPDCCGLLFPLVRGDQADLKCNECGFVLCRVPTANLRRTQDELQLSLDVASEKCPHCDAVNLFPGFSSMLAYTCRNCGELVRLSNDPSVEAIFGPENEGQEDDGEL